MFFSVLVGKSEVPRLNSHPWRSRPGWEEANLSWRLQRGQVPRLPSWHHWGSQTPRTKPAPQGTHKLPKWQSTRFYRPHAIDFATAIKSRRWAPLSDQELSKTRKRPHCQVLTWGKGPLWLQSMANATTSSLQERCLVTEFRTTSCPSGGLCRPAALLQY